MAKRSTRTNSRARNRQDVGRLPSHDAETMETDKKPQTLRKPITPMNTAQRQYMESIERNVLTFGIGPAGTGKTYVSVSTAAKGFLKGQYEQMIFSRPALGAEEELGFFKGDLDEKFAPWAAPIRDVLDIQMGSGFVDYLVRKKVIKFQPFATMRGLSWANSFVMLDEAQNTTPNQMKLFLSRVGTGTTVVVDGDMKQQDLVGQSGLSDAHQRLALRESVGSVRFTVEDIVRSGFARMVVEAYDE